MSEFGIYVHWPFCAAKCPYCDFNSHVRSTIDEARWCEGILRELGWVRSAQGGLAPKVETVFFGGGTPSLASGKAIAAVLDAIARLWNLAQDLEITLEANPASADADRFRDYRAAGVNRISLGIQALDDRDLKFLGRLHDAAEAKTALKSAMATFDHVSLDLIYARPDQSAPAWRAELQEALAFGTEHLSLYQLTIEPNTPFARDEGSGKLRVPGEDSAAALYSLTQEVTQTAGRPAYEISNHAVPGRECRHNLLYWRYGSYAGVGPGAHGRLVLNDTRISTAAERLPERWLEMVGGQGHGYGEWQAIDAADGAREHLLMTLRLREGLDLGAYESRWSYALDRGRISELVAQDLLVFEDGRLSATKRGQLLLNRVIVELAP
ncbi:MAG TPA: radical SAM family heme chaperone HemW [Rhizomicrobium sp.]|nr:radical SAM family heme chaperone HemW [Rhizomicrobium sp.]